MNAWEKYRQKEIVRKRNELSPFMVFGQNGTNRGLSQYNRGDHIYVLTRELDVVIYKKTEFVHKNIGSLSLARERYCSDTGLVDKTKSTNELSIQEKYIWARNRVVLLTQSTSVDKLMHRLLYFIIYGGIANDIINNGNIYGRGGSGVSNDTYLFKNVYKANIKKRKYTSSWGPPLATQDSHGRIFKLEEVYRFSIPEYFKERNMPPEYLNNSNFYYRGF